MTAAEYVPGMRFCQLNRSTFSAEAKVDRLPQLNKNDMVAHKARNKNFYSILFQFTVHLICCREKHRSANMSPIPFTTKVVELLRSIPLGKVATYGQIAALAGSPRAARQVVRVLHTLSSKENLPWHRVVNKEGRIALKPFQGYERQKERLESEGIVLGPTGRIDLDRHLWRPGRDDSQNGAS